MSSDLQLLPPELAALSVSDHEIVLPYPAALNAVDYLAEHGVQILGWEAWERRPDGSLTHPHPGLGSGDLAELTLAEAAAVSHRTISEAVQEELGPGIDELLFCIAVRAA